MKWAVDKAVRPDRTVHVWPATETGEHVLHGTDCECIPILELYPEGGVTLVNHQTFSRPRVLLD